MSISTIRELLENGRDNAPAILAPARPALTYAGLRKHFDYAMNNSPSIEELIANRHKIVHEMYDPETGESQW